MTARQRFFIIDVSPDYRALVGHHLTSHWVDSEAVEYDPSASGRLPESFSGTGYALVLLGDPGPGEEPLEWLRQFGRQPRFPPVILLGDGSERQIVEAMKAGAAEYLSKPRLNHRRLIRVAHAVLDAGKPKRDLAAAGLPSFRGYEILEELSSTDVATVYLTRDTRTGEPLVFKFLRQTQDTGGEVALDRFLREYQLIAGLDHPNIVRIKDLGVADDHAYIAMEHCAQGSLKRRIAAGMNSERAFSYMRQMAAALGALHEVGIVHRDLKPTNVMFRDDGSLVLIDFGLARQAKMRAEITGAGEIFGTPYYMSPEQGHGNDVDERGDIYALGVIFYEMLTGSKPYEAETPMTMIIRHRRAPIPRLPPELAAYQPAVDRMMAKAPEDRFQTVDELLEWRPMEYSQGAAQA